MSYLKLLKNVKFAEETRWLVKFKGKTDVVREVKQVYDPNLYKTFKHSRDLVSQNELIKILEDDKEKRK